MGLVSHRKEAQHVYYKIANALAHECMESLGKVAHSNLAEVDRLINQHLMAKDSLEPISSEELRQRLKADQVTLIDVRPNGEYEAGHIRGAINVTLEELEDFIATHPVQNEVIAYCRGPYCMMSFEAVQRLRAQGIKSHRLEEGYPEWSLAGMPIEGLASG